MNQVYLCIPAKAILFGEYGVLYGGKAVAVTFFDHCFNISLKIKRLEENSSIKIKSDFFSNQNIQFSIHDNNENKNNDPNIFFFSNLIKPWNSYLENCELNIEIQKSFSPSLGFGSSSALIAGISAGLWELIYQNKEYLNKIEFWNVEGHELDSNIDFNDKPNAYGKYQGTSSNHDKVIAGIVKEIQTGIGQNVEGIEGVRSIDAIEKIYANILQ